MKRCIYLIVILSYGLINMLYAQIDSTFIKYYDLSSSWWNYFDDTTTAANVFEDYSGNLCLQTIGTFHTPPPQPELVISQSPIIRIDRNGNLINTAFGPIDLDGNMVSQSYKCIFKDNNGGYLTVPRQNPVLACFDSCFQYIGNRLIYTTDNIQIYIRNILSINNTFIIIGLGPLGFPNFTVFSCYNSDFVPIWEYKISGIYGYSDVISTSDEGYLFYWQDNGTKAFKVSSTGDSLWTISRTQCHYNIVETQNRYYSAHLQDIDILHGLIDIYSLGNCFEAGDSLSPTFSMSTYPFFQEWEKGISFERMSDGNLILAVSTPTGELFKFDNNLSLLWSSNYLNNERIGTGYNPFIELPNGDILYCARIPTPYNTPIKLALVRLDATGHATPIEDDVQDIPQVNQMRVYPNPFNKELTIDLKLNKPIDLSKLYFNVYNVKGQLVESIQTQSTNIKWNPNSISSGLYIIKLRYDNIDICKNKVIFTK